MNKKIFAILSVLFLVLFNYANISVKRVFAQSNTAEIVMELNSNRVLHQINAQDKKYMASTTKILTAITIIENCNLTDIVTVGKDTIGIEGSSIYLEKGEKLTVKDLLYGLMLRSGNDCAETLAVYCSGDIQKFANLMNQTAKKIGAINSNFVNPHGLHDDNHYTTAYDLAKIACYAMKNSAFREIVGTKKVRIPFTTRNTVRLLVNKNKMLSEFEGSTGIKTGYTKKAGRCLVSSCTRNGMELICVVLNCPPMFERSKELLSDYFNSHQNVKLVESDNVVGFTDYNGKKIPLIIKEDVVLPLTNSEKKKIRVTYEYPEFIKNIDNIEKEVGLVKIYSENNLIFEQKIYTILSE